MCCQLLLEALIILFRVTGLCAATTFSIVHPSLDVPIIHILILIIFLIKPYLIKKNQSIWRDDEDYEGQVILLQEMGITGIIYCIIIDANQVFLCKPDPIKGRLWSLMAQAMAM